MALGKRMSLHSTTRVPVDDGYAALVGKAVYVFAYYEWALIYIVEFLRSGFVAEYSRGRSLTSGDVEKRFRSVIEDPATNFSRVSKDELLRCADRFRDLIVRRNALIHAHPCTDTDGSQILTYQTRSSKPLPDMKWPVPELVSIISTFDVAACDAGVVLDRLRR